MNSFFYIQVVHHDPGNEKNKKILPKDYNRWTRPTYTNNFGLDNSCDFKFKVLYERSQDNQSAKIRFLRIFSRIIKNVIIKVT